jgi:hypothetical protein
MHLNCVCFFIEHPSKKILWAAENNKLDVVKELLNSDSSLTGTKDNDGYTPLHRASYNGHTDMVMVSSFPASTFSDNCHSCTPYCLSLNDSDCGGGVGNLTSGSRQ